MASAWRMIAWVNPQQRHMLESLLEPGHVRLVAVGSPVASDAAPLARALKVPALADLRVAVQREDAELLWVADPTPLSAIERRLLRESQLRVFSSEPVPGSVADLFGDAEPAAAQFAPLMRRSPGHAAAADVLLQFGEPRCISLQFLGGPEEGSLFARLFDAMDVVERVFGVAESIDAALAGPRGGVPESLPSMRGHITMNLRFAGGRAAAVVVSSAAGRWSRRVTMLGEAGCLTVTDGGFTWSDAGRTVDEQRGAEPAGAGELISDQVRRMIERLDTGAPPPETARLLALCEAARLSCRTGQSESPRRMMEMSSRL